MGIAPGRSWRDRSGVPSVRNHRSRGLTYPYVRISSVTVPKVDGGLGVIYIRRQNEALLLKNLHKFFNKLDLPWVNLIWEKH